MGAKDIIDRSLIIYVIRYLLRAAIVLYSFE
jgi:hypothetical protein